MAFGRVRFCKDTDVGISVLTQRKFTREEGRLGGRGGWGGEESFGK